MFQSRTFQRLGETENRRFCGKIIAATNRDLTLEMQTGRFRHDFYYRLCSDMITTPSLAEQLADSAEDLRHLLVFITQRIAGDEAEALADEVQTWIGENLGPDHPWPGNIRELEQCVRNVMIRQHYSPAHPTAASGTDDPRQVLADAAYAGSISADELMSRYCTLVYAQTGSYEKAARQLGLDRRTVKKKVDAALAAKLRDGGHL